MITNRHKSNCVNFDIFPELFVVFSNCVVAPELKVNIDRLSQTLEGIYSDNSLCQVNQTHTLKIKNHYKKMTQSQISRPLRSGF